MGPSSASTPAQIQKDANGSSGACLRDNKVEPRSVDGEKMDTMDEKGAPSKQPDPQISFWKLFSNADRLDQLFMVIGTLGAMANGAAFPMFAIVFGEFSDVFGQDAGTDDFMSKVSQLALYFVYIACAAAVAAYFQGSMWQLTGYRQTARLRNLYLSAVLRQDVSYFDTQTTTGSLLKGLEEDSSNVQAAISDKLGHFIQHTCCFFVGYIVAFWRGWDMTLVMLGTLPFLAGVGAILSKLATNTNMKSEAAYAKASTIAQESISQIRTVTAYNAEETSIQSYSDSLQQPVQAGIQQSLVAGLCNGGVFAIVYWTYALAFIYGSWRVSTGDYTGGDVMNVLVAALVGGFSAGQAAPVLSTFALGRVAGAKLYAVIERQPSIDVDSEAGEKLPNLKGHLELRDVCFTYPARTDIQIFKNFNLVIPAGKTVALVGSSGSGKSTAVQLIERFYDPSSGTVLLDGVDLRALNLNWLRQQIGLVSQEPTLFATTIFENIAMGKEGATEEEVRAAATAANALRFINNLPLQFNTQVGERGLSLSGGQKQRIAIARAILKNPRIMLLDEATSALDTESERVVQDALNRMIVGRTTVVVAHRLSTIKDADVIAVVSKGVVVEQGNHASLITNPEGHYTTLVKLQMKEEVEKGAAAASNKDPALNPEDPDDIVALHDEAGAAAAAAVPPGAASGALAPKSSGGLKGLWQGGSMPAGEAGALAMVDLEQGLKAEGQAVQLVVVPKEGGDKAAAAVEAAGRRCCGLLGPKKEGKEEEAPVQVSFSRLLSYNKPELPFFGVGIVAAAAAGCTQPAYAFLISSMISTFYDTLPSDVMHKASFLCWMFFTLGAGSLIAVGLMHWSLGICGQWLGYRVRLALFRNILYQEVGWFDLDKNASGVLTTRLATDASLVRGAVGDTLGVMMQNLFCLAAGLIIAFVFDWRMALLVLGILPFMVSGTIIHYKSIAGLSTSNDKHFSGANQAVSDAVSSIRIVHAYTLRSQVCNLYQRMVSGASKDIVNQSYITGATQGYSQFCMFVVYGLIIWFGGLEVESGRATFDEMLKAFLAILLAAMGLAQSSMGFPDMGKAKAAVGNVFPLIDRESLIDASSDLGNTAGDDFKGEIELKDVTFHYPSRPSVTVFSHFNLVIPAGKTVALVGESGSGKSTIVGLIERFYDPSSGLVLLDGVDLRQYNLRWLRKQIGIVSQEPLLFASSILDNIRFGKPSATMEEVEAAAKAANAYDFITGLPDGFNTLVGERGMQLSGGQKQRVAIARAVVKQPRIMLLDEATSALDARAEREVQEALDKIMVGRTSIVVAHRLSTIRDADLIALVFRGSILEQGTHDELMAIPDGGYKSLVATQMGSRAVQPVPSQENLQSKDV